MTLFCPQCGEGYDNSLSVCPTDGVRLYAVAPPQSSLIGEVLEGRFRIVSLLGEGGMGAVYRAVQTSVGRDVAVKVLHADFEDDQAALERFFREAKFVSELTHPSIVRVIDFGQEPRLKILYLVMELIEGPTLDSLVRGARLDVNFALEIAYQICGGLTDPHASHVVHRDLKPANLFVNLVSDGSIQVKICDFGIARALTRSTRLTMEGGICGTPAYMSPEQATDLALDPRTDLYSLGVILYQMLTGWLPFDAPSSLQLMLKHVQATPPPFSEILSDAPLPPSVELLVTDLMQKSADARPASARVVRERINRIRAELGLLPIQLDAATKGQKDVFSKWVVALESHPDTSYGLQPDSREFAVALTQALSNTETALLGPSMTETQLLSAHAHQTPAPGAAEISDPIEQLAMVRVPTESWGLANEAVASVALLASPAPQTQAPAAPNPTPTPQRTASQPVHTVESLEKATPSATSNRLLLTLLALVLGALLVASMVLGFLWLGANQTAGYTSSEASKEATIEAPAAIHSGDDSNENLMAAPEVASTKDEARDALEKEPAPPEAVERPPSKAIASPQSNAAQSQVKPAPTGASAEKSAPKIAQPTAAAPKTSAPSPPTNTDPKSSPAPNPTDASKRLEALFEKQGLRKE